MGREALLLGRRVADRGRCKGEKDALLLGHRVRDRCCRRNMRAKDAGRLGPWVARRNAARSLVCGSSYDRDLFVKPAVGGFQPLVKFNGIVDL